VSEEASSWLETDTEPVTPVEHRTNAAEAFFVTASDVLVKQGERASMLGIARIIGENRNTLRARVTGKHDVGTEKLRRWLEAWTAAGYPRIEVRMGDTGPEGVVVGKE